jgi:hypothetical protein
MIASADSDGYNGCDPGVIRDRESFCSAAWRFELRYLPLERFGPFRGNGVDVVFIGSCF